MLVAERRWPREKVSSNAPDSDSKDSSILLAYEVLIVDNGRADGTAEIATQNGARVVLVEEEGYGAALLAGIAAARGKYIVMGDSDCSNDFGDVPRFLNKLEEGYDFVMGNRFALGTMPGALPWHQRYIGKPLLSGLGRFPIRTPSCRDWHCGLVAFDREKIDAMHLDRLGDEFASELVVRVRKAGLRTAAIPTTLYPDGRERPPHVRRICDRWRHLHLAFATLPTKTQLVIHLISFTVFFCMAFSVQFGLKYVRGNGLIIDVPSHIVLTPNVFSNATLKIECTVKSSAPVQIVGARVSCPCLKPIGLPLNVPAQDETPIEMELTLQSYKEARTGVEDELSVTFFVLDRDPINHVIRVSVPPNQN